MPLQIIRQDITKMRIDAIVNTTNEEMIGYAGVDLAVHEGAGPELDAECLRLAPLGLGAAKITPGYNLPARYIIHTSGPVWGGGLRGESIILKSCYIECLKLAVAHGCESVAFPLISSGAYGYPKDQVLKFATQVITEFLYDHELMVYLCVYDRTSYEFSRQLYEDIRDFLDSDVDECDLDEDADWEEDALLDITRLFQRGEACDYEMAPPEMCEEKPAPKRAAMEAPSIAMPEKTIYGGSARGKPLDKYLKDMDKPFGQKLLHWIDARGMTDLECYKKANVDRKTFSKIKCHPDTYRPSKQTAVAFAIALRLDLDETQDLLASAGLTLSRSFVFDKIIRYFIQNEIYDIFVINEALFEFDQVLLGC